MKTSIATVSLSGGLGEKLEAIAAAQLDAVEIFENDLVPRRLEGGAPRRGGRHELASGQAELTK